MKFLPTLKALSVRHINTIWCLACYTEHLTFFHQEVHKQKLKTIFENNDYPKHFVDFWIKKCLYKVLKKRKLF